MEKDNMTEEEKKAIELLKESINVLKENSSIFISNKYSIQLKIEAYTTILNLIEKQQREIKELKFDIGICDKDLDSLNERIYQLKQDNKKLILGKFREVADKNEYIKSEYISKDKIRAKIKEIDEDELLQKIDFGQIALAIKVLYELLEE